MSYGIFLKILVASCSPNSSWNQSYEYFCRRLLIWSRNSSKSILWASEPLRIGYSEPLRINGFWWISHFKWRAHTKIVVTLVSGGVERATGYQDLQKHHVGNARSHQNDARGTLDAPLRISSFFSLVFRISYNSNGQKHPRFSTLIPIFFDIILHQVW